MLTFLMTDFMWENSDVTQRRCKEAPELETSIVEMEENHQVGWGGEGRAAGQT
jgi:hypothetical protein